MLKVIREGRKPINITDYQHELYDICYDILNSDGTDAVSYATEHGDMIINNENRDIDYDNQYKEFIAYDCEKYRINLPLCCRYIDGLQRDMPENPQIEKALNIVYDDVCTKAKKELWERYDDEYIAIGIKDVSDPNFNPKYLYSLGEKRLAEKLEVAIEDVANDLSGEDAVYLDVEGFINYNEAKKSFTFNVQCTLRGDLVQSLSSEFTQITIPRKDIVLTNGEETEDRNNDDVKYDVYNAVSDCVAKFLQNY